MGWTPTTRKDRTAVGIPSLFPVLCHAVKYGLGAAGRVRILNYKPATPASARFKTSDPDNRK
jgi:hypothetical protein